MYWMHCSALWVLGVVFEVQGLEVGGQQFSMVLDWERRLVGVEGAATGFQEAERFVTKVVRYLDV
jgi:hypothetical protein